MPKGFVNRSDEYRKLLFQQSERYNIPFTHLCKEVGIDYKRFVQGYANIKDMHTKYADILISDEQLIEMGKLLGLDVRFVIVIKDEKKFEENILEVKSRLKDGYINRKKERDPAGTE